MSDFLKETTFVAFDTETTGLLALTNHIVEIAAVKFWLDSNRAEQFQELINPGVPMPEEVIAIHGITDEMVSGARSVATVFPSFIEFCGEDAILIAHNAPFDISFIAQELKRTDLTFGKSTVIDTVDIFRRYYPGLPGYSLLSLSKRFGLADSQSHRALADSEMVTSLFRKAVEKFPPDLDRSNLADHMAVLDIDSFLEVGIKLPKRFASMPAAIEKGQRLQMVYAKPGADPHPRIVRPLGLQQTNGVVYLTAFCELVNADRTFRLDRIQTYLLIED